MGIGLGIAFRNLHAEVIAGTGNGANDVTVAHHIGTMPSVILPQLIGAVQGTLPATVVSANQNNIVFRGDAAAVYAILVMK